tara:strand:- start:2335 stop:2817 length:483 start_codon:yes stop_codon:yes gene_type:complete
MSKTENKKQDKPVMAVKWENAPLTDASRALVQTFTRDWIQNCGKKQLALVKEDLKMQVEAEVAEPSPSILTPTTAKLLIEALRANLAFYKAMAPSTEGTRRKVESDVEALITQFTLIVEDKMKPLDKKAAEAAAKELAEKQAAMAELLAQMKSLEGQLEL